MRLRSILAATTLAGQGKYTGELKTKRTNCARNRTVQVLDLSQGGFVIGQTTTQDNGSYELTEYLPNPGSQVSVVVPKKNKKNGSCPGVERTATVPG